jgi:hypothetical protein
MARQGNTEQKKQKPQYEETLRKNEYAGANRKAGEAKQSAPARVQNARKAVFGAGTNVDGSSFLTPLKKDKTSGGTNNK